MPRRHFIAADSHAPPSPRATCRRFEYFETPEPPFSALAGSETCNGADRYSRSSSPSSGFRLFLYFRCSPQKSRNGDEFAVASARAIRSLYAMSRHGSLMPLPMPCPLHAPSG